MRNETPHNTLRQKFNEGFTAGEIHHDAIASLPHAAIGDFLLLYSESIQPNVQFKIDFEKTADKESYAFIINRSTDDEGLETLAHFIFSLRTGGQYYNLHHRLAATGDIGITGSDVLIKAESFLTNLMEAGAIPEKEFRMDAAQEEVIDWALRNNYEFDSPLAAERYRTITDGDPNYERGITITNEKGWERHGFIFKKELAAWAKSTRSGPGGSDRDITQSAERFSLVKAPEIGASPTQTKLLEFVKICC